jgi:3-dehydroquinate synthetase
MARCCAADDVTMNDQSFQHPAGVWSVDVRTSVGYEVALVEGLFEKGNNSLLGTGTGLGSARRFVVIDSQVDALYGELIRAYFDRADVHCGFFSLAAEEKAKALDNVSAIAHALDSFGIDRRREPIIAIGGGVVLDVAGLAASLYRRGTPYIRVPTTLIGLVDAGVGVKTAVNHGFHKNGLGTYFAPHVVLCDRRFLATLDTRHIANGLAEVLKIGLIRDRALFELLAEHGRLLLDERLQGLSPEGGSAADEVIQRAITGMLDELRPNLWEQQLDRLVDYGHSMSPAIEMLALPQLLHGEAVNVDMALFTAVAQRRGVVSSAEAFRIFRVMRALGLPVWHPLLERSVLAKALTDTTQHRGGQQRLPLLTGIGSACFVNDVTPDELVAAAERLLDEERQGA